MTAILVCRVRGRVLLGSDRAWSDGVSVGVCGPKVIRCGPWWLGCAGQPEGDWEALGSEDPRTVREVSELLGRCSADAILVRDRTVRLGTCSGKRWTWGVVYGDVAIGSGGVAGLAAWDALRAYETDPRVRMRAALKAVAKNQIDVCGPFDVVFT